MLWVPDWPVAAHAQAHRIPLTEPIALIEKGMVFACSAAARAEGVRRGMRQREAQSRCTGLHLLRYDAALDSRAFEPVLTALEESLPGLHPVRPGTVAVRARGPARYYGGEQAAALTVLGTSPRSRSSGARVGIADGLFAAERAARWVGGRRPHGHHRAARASRARSWRRCRSRCSKSPSWSGCSPGSASARWASSPRSASPT